MPVSSYILRCEKDHHFQLLARLCAMPGVIVGECNPGGIPVAAETSSDAEAWEMGDRLRNLPGVRGAVLVYHNFEDMELQLKERHENQSS